MSAEFHTHKFLWLDLETTGLLSGGVGALGTSGASILEWALVLADDGAPQGSLDCIESYSGIIDPGCTPQMDDFVRDMHTKNGLLAEIDAGEGTTLAEADGFLFALAQELTDRKQPRNMVLAGNSVHFDLAWVRHYMPRFASCLSHRVFDVSTLLLQCEAWLPDFQRPARSAVHRALADVQESLQLAKYCRQAVGL